MDRRIINPWFATAFLGAPLFSLLSVALHLGPSGRPALPWAAAALVLNLLVVMVTLAVSVPLNKRLQDAGPPAQMADLRAVRARFEDRWVRWNALRTVAAVAAFAALAVALLRAT